MVPCACSLIYQKLLSWWNGGHPGEHSDQESHRPGEASSRVTEVSQVTTRRTRPIPVFVMTHLGVNWRKGYWSDYLWCAETSRLSSISVNLSNYTHSNSRSTVASTIQNFLMWVPWNTANWFGPARRWLRLLRGVWETSRMPFRASMMVHSIQTGRAYFYQHFLVRAWMSRRDAYHSSSREVVEMNCSFCRHLY